MAAYEIEIILTRQWADCLSIPAFITDTSGNLIFYNEPAEKLLGTRFEETGEMKVETWGTCFKQKDEEGNILPPESLPLVRRYWIVIPITKHSGLKACTGNRKGSL